MEVSAHLNILTALFPRIESPTAIEYESGWAPEPVWMRWLSEGSCVPARNRT